MAGVLGAGDVLHQHGEFVAAKPRHHVVAAHAAGQSRAGFLQHHVAEQVADAVVDHLEAIQVEEQHGALVAALLLIVERGL